MFPERRIDLILQCLDDELLVYDPRDHRVHCLNATARAVWEHCDGRTPVEAIAREVARELGAPADPDLADLALARLAEAGLLAGPLPAGRHRVSRREASRRLLAAGVASALLPVVQSILAPTAAEAGTCSGSGFACVIPAHCCSGVCNAGICA